MNQLNGNIHHIASEGALSLVEVMVGLDTLYVILVETPETVAYLQAGQAVGLLFKETEVALARHLTGSLSIRNRLKGLVQAIKQGQLLTEVTLDYQGYSIVSLITTAAAKALQLEVGVEVEALIKTNEMTLAKL